MVLAFAALVLVVGMGVRAVLLGGFTPASRSVSGFTPGTPSPRSSNPTATLVPGGNHQVGEAVTYNGHWQITISNVTTTNGDQRWDNPTPRPGETYLVIEGTFRNLQDHSDVLSTLAECDVRDSQGNTYIEAVLFSVTPPDGNIAAGDSVQGTWAYQVPITIKRFMLTFSEDFGQTFVAWSITVP
jgi:hypothetical protein